MQIGFAGSRFLYAPRRLSESLTAEHDLALLPQLTDRLQELPAKLGRPADLRWRGISQVAIGADLLFTRALALLGRPQLVLLPLPLDAFLSDGDPDAPDFTAGEQVQVRDALAGRHIEGLRVVSAATDRVQRFEDANRAVLAASDAIAVLLRKDALPQPGGTRDLMQRARAAGKPVWRLIVSMQDGRPGLSAWEPALS